MKEIITDGKTFVFIGSRESFPDLARRWFNYGFNDYVDGRYSRSLYDYRRYVIEHKANDQRGQWIRAWMEYGYTLGILYYEVFHPDLEKSYNAFVKDADLLDFLNLDSTKYPPGHDPKQESWEYRDSTNLYSLVRVSEDGGDYKTVDFWHSGNPCRDTFEVLAKMGYPDKYEMVSFNYWKKGAKQ